MPGWVRKGVPTTTSDGPTGPTFSRAALQAAVATELPLPGRGLTAQRWAQLAEVARGDLALAKLVEPHHDATAILADLGGRPPAPGEVWAVWAAEPPGAGFRAEPASQPDDGSGWRLSGRKPFCSGAAVVTHALITAHDVQADASRLFAVDLRTERDLGARAVVEPAAWAGAGMAAADTRTLACADVRASPVGEPGAYTDRVGFWHGGIGVAACWVGGVRGVAARLLDAVGRRPPTDLTLMHLGAVGAAVDRCEAMLAVAAVRADTGEHTTPDVARRDAETVRATVADAVDEVVSRVGRALGPGPLALDAEHARRVADLQVFVRQHHGEADLVALGRLLLDGGTSGLERW
ncbi:acyl-CoA dehydrogenase [soil metagenome]